MVEYYINLGNKSSHYSPNTGNIFLGMAKTEYAKLTDKELIIITADTLTHEFIHYTLSNMFNNTVSMLFDTIGHLFYIDYNLKNKTINETAGKKMTWKNYIKEYGIKAFHNKYDLTNSDIYHASQICNIRSV